jgi:CheY-like chemotaxis protein
MRAAVGAAVRLVKQLFRNGKVPVKENPYDLIILDWKIPGMSSIEVAFGDLLAGYNVTLILKRNIFIRRVCGILIC